MHMMVDLINLVSYSLYSWQPILNSYDTPIKIQIPKVERITYSYGQTIGPKRDENSKTNLKQNIFVKYDIRS